MPVARIYLVRHGETEENRQRIIQGHLDCKLNATGLEQSEAVARALQSVPFEIARSSDLVRAAKTAEIILKYHPGVILHTQMELREQFLGERQGMSIAAGATIQCSFESEEDLLQRAMTWWNSIRADIASLESRSDPHHLLVVTHGFYLKTLIKGLINSGKAELEEKVAVRSYRFLNCSVTLLEIDATGVAKLIKCGDIEHLHKAQLAHGIVQVNADEMVAKQ